MMESIGASPRPQWRQNRSAEHTARSCLTSADVVLEMAGGSLAGSRVAIEGFREVGSALAPSARGEVRGRVHLSRALHRDDGLDVNRLVQRARQAGSCFVEGRPGAVGQDVLPELPVDVALSVHEHDTIHAGNVARISARAICARRQRSGDPRRGGRVARPRRGHPPDFVTNCGGVLGLEFAGVPFRRVGALIDEHLRRCLVDLLDRAARLEVAPREVAEADALERHARVRAASRTRAWLSGCSLALEAYRRRLIPKRPVSLAASRSVARWMT